MRRITVAAVFVLIAMATVNAQQGTADLRGRVVDSQQGSHARRDGRRPPPGERNVS